MTVRPVLDLAEDIGRGEFCITADLVGDDQRLGRASEQIDADAAIKLALGFGDEGVARACEDIDRINALCAQRHRTNSLNAAQRIDRIGSRHGLRGNDGAGDGTLKRRSAGNDAADAGNFGGNHAHVGRGEQRILAARHIAASRIDRHVSVTENDAGHGLYLNVRHRIALDLGGVSHLRLRELDVLALLRTQAVYAGIDFGLAQAIVGAVPAVEPYGHVAHSSVAAFLDVGEARFDNVPHLAIGVCLRFRGRAAFEPLGHVTPRTID